MPATQIQKKEYNSTGDNLTHTITLNSAPVRGNLLVLCLSAYDTIVGIPEGFTEVIHPGDFVDGILYYKIAQANEPAALTFTYLPIALPLCIQAFEYKGINELTPLDKSASAVGQGASNSIGTGTTATTSQANELIFAVAAMRPEGGTITAWSNSFTSENSTLSTGSSDIELGLDVATRVVSATGTYTTTATTSGTSINHDVGIIVSFRIADTPTVAWFRA